MRLIFETTVISCIFLTQSHFSIHGLWYNQSLDRFIERVLLKVSYEAKPGTFFWNQRGSLIGLSPVGLIHVLKDAWNRWWRTFVKNCKIVNIVIGISFLVVNRTSAVSTVVYFACKVSVCVARNANGNQNWNIFEHVSFYIEILTLYKSKSHDDQFILWKEKRSLYVEKMMKRIFLSSTPVVFV